MCRIKICILLVSSTIIYGGESDNKLNSAEIFNNLQKCGTTRYDKTNMRIIDGEKAALGQFPWIARLGKKQRDGKIIFRCGGSLISKLYVITAAHCMKVHDIIRLGENTLNTNIDCDRFHECAPPPQDINIQSFQTPNFSQSTLENDFALVKLKKPAKFNDYVQPICLPDKAVPYEGLVGKYVTISGWGLSHVMPNKLPNNLMYITAPIIDKENCSAVYEEKLLDNQMCIGYNMGKDSCDGDSGGPAIKTYIRNGIRRAFIIGVVSYGLVVCGTGPAVYTDVYSFLNWTLERITNC